ncbi:oxygen-dependent tRNA uridine(34) hydroxylase TrhO [Polaribacter irgensii]|nr:rhodanese-related sulfurtransferase [Polaribacter irgensii]
MQLYNKLSGFERAALIDEAGKDRITVSFYQYFKIETPQLFRDKLFLEWNALDILGRIYVSFEGINAQLSVPSENLHALKNQLDSISFLRDIRLNVALAHDNKSFLKLKIKVKNKIVADGLKDETFDVTNRGVHLNATEFNAMLAHPDTVCVDMRNHYESEIGYFEGAVTPDVDTFRDSLDVIEQDLKNNKEDKNLLMYCTGGIRCEKASAYYKHKGFKNVFQLEGGIIEYTRQVQAEGIENKFIGKNFVFDQRRAEKITEDVVASCHQCGVPCDTHTNCANDGCHLLFIQCDECSEAKNNTCSEECQDVIQLSSEVQKELRRGKEITGETFKKGRSAVLKFKKKFS